MIGIAVVMILTVAKLL